MMRRRWAKNFWKVNRKTSPSVEALVRVRQEKKNNSKSKRVKGRERERGKTGKWEKRKT